MDLRFAQYPILCGHYQADSIAGAEYQIDLHLLNGELSQRERMGIYAGAIGTSTIVLNPRNAEDLKRGTGRGAIIIGLGEWSQINAQNIIDSVRDGVLQYLLYTREGDLTPAGADEVVKLNLSSLLIGYNSTTHITVEASIEAIVRGVCEANQQYRYNRVPGQALRAIAKLEFIEFYLDTAITAAYTVRDLPQRLEKELKRLDARIDPLPELQIKQGMRHRLSERSSGGGYWPRLMVTDAENTGEQCPAECYQDRILSPIPRPVLESWKQQLGVEDKPRDASADYPTHVLAERLKYVYLSERARAEAIVQQRQPGLIEALIKDAIRSSEHKADISRTLFQLMVPLDFKSAARQTDRMLLILDGYTANLPWEMLQADEEPLAIKMAVVRQLVSTRFRKKVANTLSKTACVIGNPATTDFFRYFPLPAGGGEKEGDLSLKSLPGAVEEAQTVTKTLTAAGYKVTPLYPQTADEPPLYTAIDVFNVLFKQPYRILMIAAHGEVNIRGRDGKERTGVVLSDGVMLTAAEIGQMEEVPDLVFLNCCHLAKTDTSPTASFNRLAYSISRELIEMGVRCVIAAGWAVDDAAAATFSATFFQAFVQDSRPFGHAVWEARKKTWELHHGLNTWGAYQAYGDPNYVLDTESSSSGSAAHWSPVAPQELCSKLESLAVDIRYKTSHYTFDSLMPVVDQLLERVPSGWLKEPGTQYKLACLYGDMLPDGFERARAAYQAAIAEEDQKGNVPIQALESLANLEARQAEELARQAENQAIELGKLPADSPEIAGRLSLKDSYLKDSQNLIKTAIQRLEGLLDITRALHLGGRGNTEEGGVNTERHALLGSAYKRQAMISLRSGEAWDKVKEILEKSRAYYQLGEGLSFNYNFKPYAMVNRLQLDGILGLPLDNQIQLAEKAQVAARQQFTGSYDFFDAVMLGDAAVAIFLLNVDKLQREKPEQLAEDVLIQIYRNCISEVSHSSRQINSAIQQLEYLALFLRNRAGDASSKQVDADKARVLQAVIAELQQM
ncbi:MAG: CHAT domain-containing protein [Thiolinea sp.]